MVYGNVIKSSRPRNTCWPYHEVNYFTKQKFFKNTLPLWNPWAPFKFMLGSVQFSSVTQSCLTLCDPMDCSMPGLPVHHQLWEGAILCSFFKIEIWLIYNVVLVSGIWQSDSDIYMCVCVYTYVCIYIYMGFPGCVSGKKPARQCRKHKRCGFDP